MVKKHAWSSLACKLNWSTDAPHRVLLGHLSAAQEQTIEQTNKQVIVLDVTDKCTILLSCTVKYYYYYVPLVY